MDREQYEARMWEIRKNRERIEALDADIRQRVGSNEPLASFRVLAALEEGPKDMTAIIMHARSKGYQGPDSRLCDAIGRLANEFHQIRRRGKKYFMSPRSA